MRYGQIRRYDVANGPGIRTSFFVTGCTHHCPDCFNEEYQDFNAGKIWTDTETEEVIKYLSEDVVEGLTILGGEPFQNTLELIDILKQIKSKTNKSIWVYSGYTYEQILKDKSRSELLNLCDVLVDGLFVNSLKDLTLKFRGSSNQRIIDVKTSKLNKIVLWNE
ncbi:anaerobic ribonucleoside-triphosphate reductase activating protein [Anaerosphaera multitolerans]|uniref:Anaerobic ribonucleoside-triphosphate reductase-activating protein n=1 Tax=Anaerosphaera multitolerans TaxID=2487351 RepID=A0A437S8E5_9FIRM|nr:anaerobic ribonucleoside-triphosphate reductase activating protein [Anaerosphaera multitolerans]RVU55359.1 anaerobic ribonucleoside-triphosphate reductase activating protein [Anaerosphaera multitolerans]